MTQETVSSRDSSLGNLTSRLQRLESRVREVIAVRRSRDPQSDDPHRGLYISDEEVQKLLALEGGAASTPAGLELAVADNAEPRDRLSELARNFGLNPFDVWVLIVAFAPDLDRRFERIYGFLNDDVTHRRPTVSLVLELCGMPSTSPWARSRLRPGAPLVDWGLVVLEGGDRPFLSRPIRVPDRVTGHLIGDDGLSIDVAAILADSTAGRSGDPSSLMRALKSGARLLYLREKRRGTGRGLAEAAFDALGTRRIAFDLNRLPESYDADELARSIALEAALQDAGLIIGPVDDLAVKGSHVRALAEIRWPVVLTGTRPWDPAWSREIPLVIEVATPTPEERSSAWRMALNGAGELVESTTITDTFRLGPDEVHRAARSAQMHAVSEGREIQEEDLRVGARAQNSSGLERLARKITPSVGWGDLVLSPPSLQQLKELTGRTRNREKVLDDWGMRRGSRGEGIACLFTGPSGTGKTMAAEVIAGDLGLDLYTLNLATVVDKYIGETEKNLDRVFHEAEGINGVLFFDEADALFGRRSEVKDAHDRYANIEVAYLLQRMESFEGLAILATNLGANIDEAFARRLSMSIDFPMPDPDLRLRLWEQMLGPPIPTGDDLDLQFCAGAFGLSGGNIRNILLAAAFLAAENDEVVGMRHIIRAIQQEYRKLGRMCVEAEFGRYYELLAQ